LQQHGASAKSIGFSLGKKISPTAKLRLLVAGTKAQQSKQMRMASGLQSWKRRVLAALIH
jgi:hypothetical protein